MLRDHVVPAAVTVVFAALALGSGSPKKEKDGPSASDPKGAASLTSAGTTPAASKPTGNGPDARKPASMNGARLVATCLKKSAGVCEAYYNEAPTDLPKDCPNAGGVLERSGNDCPSEGLLGSCVYPPREKGAMAQISSFYGSSTKRDAAKTDCLELPDEKHPNEWIEGPAAASPAASPAAKPAAPAAKPKPKGK